MKNKSLEVTVSVKEFGARGDSFTDDTEAVMKALKSSCNIFFPSGIYKINSRLDIKSNKNIFGEGDSSVILLTTSNFEVFNINNNNYIKDIKIIGGSTALKILGSENKFENILIDSSAIGIFLDNYSENNIFNNISILKPKIHGVLLSMTEGKRMPSNNNFSKVNIFSQEEDTQGYGIFLQNAVNTKFTDVDINIYEGSNGCIRVFEANKTSFQNLKTFVKKDLENIIIDEESKNTMVINHAYAYL